MAPPVEQRVVFSAQAEGLLRGLGADVKGRLKERLKAAVIVLATVDAAGKVVLVAGVTPGEVGRIKAGEVVAQAASLVGGRGGGRADFAQAGGTDAAKLPEALAAVVPFVRNRLGV